MVEEWKNKELNGKLERWNIGNMKNWKNRKTKNLMENWNSGTINHEKQEYPINKW